LEKISHGQDIANNCSAGEQSELPQGQRAEGRPFPEEGTGAPACLGIRRQYLYSAKVLLHFQTASPQLTSGLNSSIFAWELRDRPGINARHGGNPSRVT